MSVIGRGILTRRVMDVITTRQHPLYIHIASTSPTQCLYQSNPLLHSQKRHLTLSQSHPYTLSSPANPSLHPSLSFLTPSFPRTSFSSSPSLHKARPKVAGGSPEERKQRVDKSVVVTLIDVDDKVSAITLDKAERLARRRDLKLVKVDDPTMAKGSKVYKLITGKQYFEEQMMAKSEKKSTTAARDEKVLVIGGKISPHDLGVKIHSLVKWLKKGHQVKVTITSKRATKEDVESVFTTIEEEVKKIKGRVLQRQEKMNDIKFYIAPFKDEKKKENVTDTETTNTDELKHSEEESSDRTKA